MMVKVVKVGNATFPIGNYITPGGMCISLYESYYFYLHYLHPITNSVNTWHPKGHPHGRTLWQNATEITHKKR